MPPLAQPHPAQAFNVPDFDDDGDEELEEDEENALKERVTALRASSKSAVAQRKLPLALAFFIYFFFFRANCFSSGTKFKQSRSKRDRYRLR